MSENIKASDAPASASTPKDADATSRRKRIILFSVLALTVAVAGAGYYSYWKRVGSRYVSTDNAYTAAEVAVVAAEIDGPVAAVNVVDSQQVKHGDVLIVIDDTDARLALRQAEADLARARAQVASATSDLERSGIDLQQRQALVASGSVSGSFATCASASTHRLFNCESSGASSASRLASGNTPLAVTRYTASRRTVP